MIARYTPSHIHALYTVAADFSVDAPRFPGSTTHSVSDLTLLHDCTFSWPNQLITDIQHRPIHLSEWLLINPPLIRDFKDMYMCVLSWIVQNT